MTSFSSNANVLLTKKQKVFLPILFFMTFAYSYVEFVGVAIIPIYFETFLSKIDYKLLKFYTLFSNYFDMSNETNFLLYSTLITICVFIVRFIYSIIYSMVNIYFSRDFYYSTVCSLYQGYVNADYLDFIKRNSADYVRMILNNANSIASMIQSFFLLISEILTLTIITGFILKNSSMITILFLLVMGVSISIAVMQIMKRAKIMGKHKERVGLNFIKYLKESFQNIRISKITKDESFLFKMFKENLDAYDQLGKKYALLEALPKQFIESSFLLLVIILIFVIRKTYHGADITNEMIVFGVGFYRLLPSITRMNSILTTLTHNQFAIQQIVTDLQNSSFQKNTTPSTSHVFETSIDLKNISFSYQPEKIVLNSVSLQITKNSCVAFIGASGQGKSTIIDIICGLLKPKSGGVFVDNKQLNEDTIFSFAQKVGYIPQSVSLYDTSFAENIIMSQSRNEEKIISLLKALDLYEVVQLKGGLNASVGEDGNCLSGGQKQRLAIARALYRDPEILIMDEGTSSLDLKTEAMVLKFLEQLKGKITIIIAAHRTSNLQFCDQIYEIKDGMATRATS